MKSNICYMENAAERENVLIEVEKTAVYCVLITWISLSAPRSTGVKMSIRPCVM